ncbi:hypothetical protein MMC32_000457 [Xylographa parallela]|nr:hypothetical protein [Xylographa parallela]
MEYLYTDESVASSEALLEKESEPRIESHEIWGRSLIVAVFLHFSFIGLYTAIFFLSWGTLQEFYAHGPHLIYDPVREARSYDTQIFDHSQVFFNYTPKPFSGLPGPELDAEWEDLLQYFNVRISEDEMRQLGKLDSNIPLPDGGYFGSLTVFHQLHCVYRLHQAIYPKFYWPNMTEEEAFLNLGHSEHCLDVIRQSLLCNADTSIMTMGWGTYQSAPLADTSNVHECVNWDSITRWAAPRTFDPFQPGYLVHPKLGPAYQNERAAKIGVAIESANPHYDSELIKSYLEFAAW